MQLADKITLSGTNRMTAEGYLDVSARISRTGVQEYYAGELYDLFPDWEPWTIVRVYRPADEVFSPAALASFSKKPVTDGHPWEGVNASNVKEHQVGFSGETMRRDGIFMAGQLLIQDAGAVNMVQRGDGQLSAGYECDVTRESGTSPEGEAYDAVQRNIIGNHIALVDAGRCGPLCRVGDRAPAPPTAAAKTADCGCKETQMTNAVAAAALIPVSDGKFTGQMDATGKAMFDTLRDTLTETTKKLADSDARLIALQTKADADKVVAEKKIADLEAAAMTPEKLDKLVGDRAVVMAKAKAVLGDSFDTKGKTDAEIRRAAVVKHYGADKVDGKSDAVLDALFDVMDVKTGDGTSGDGVQQAFGAMDSTQMANLSDAEKKREAARLASLEDKRNAWKN